MIIDGVKLHYTDVDGRKELIFSTFVQFCSETKNRLDTVDLLRLNMYCINCTVIVTK